MIIAVLKELIAHENRVAGTPATVKKFIDMGFEVIVEKDAGQKAGFDDKDFSDAGAQIAPNAQKACNNADIIIKINTPSVEEIKNFSDHATVICNFSDLDNNRQKLLSDKRLTCFALEKMPRISRAQNMDVLSSQDNLAGYRAVIKAVNHTNHVVPMMTTSAGSIAPVKIFVLGIGVAGLQAIATAKRLGALVFASDIRPETKEQAESLGAKFVESSLMAETLPKMHIIITTAGIAGHAPKLLDTGIIKTLAPHTLVLDMVGNVAGLDNFEIKTEDAITLIANHNLASDVAASASLLYANNIFNFISLLHHNEKDEILRQTLIRGEIK